MNYSKELSDKIRKKYNELKKDEDLYEYKNIKRCTMPIISRYIEDYIAILIDEINKNKNLEIFVDVPLSVEHKLAKRRNLKNPIKRADIIVYSREGDDIIIKLILEIKSQLGYCRNYATDRVNGKRNYDKRMKVLREAKEIKYTNKENDNREKIYFKLDKNFRDGVVALMNANIGEKNFNEFIDNNNYFCLFDKKEYIKKDEKTFWYDTISSENVYKDKEHGFDAFIKFIKF